MKLTWRRILFFWAPLAATWIMMASEGPFLAAIIARLVDPTFNLAAHGVAFAFAILIEAPVIMLMSASTALVEDGNSYRKLRNFTHALNLLSTGLLLVLLIPSVYEILMVQGIGLPDEVARLTYGALWFFLPWPSAIGYRRFLQGILIRSGKTRLVAIGTLVRLCAMTATAFLLYLGLALPGAWVGAASLSVGVCVEVLVAHFMVRSSIADIVGLETHEGASLQYRDITRFYYPLALTSLIGLAVHPMLTFFMGRAPLPLESLAVFPVVNALGFLFRSVGLSYQEATIALLGKDHEHASELGWFGVALGITTSVCLGLVVFTPLAYVWFSTISGLPLDLIEIALLPARILVPLPALSVLLSYQRAVLVHERRTGPITVATAIEVISISLLFTWLGWGLEWVGATAAFTAFLGGRLAGNLYLLRSTVAVLRSKSRSETQGRAPLDYEHR